MQFLKMYKIIFFIIFLKDKVKYQTYEDALYEAYTTKFKNYEK